MRGRIHLYIGLVVVFVLADGLAAASQTADQAWLRYPGDHGQKTVTHNIRTLGSGALEQSAAHELQSGFDGLTGASSSPSSVNINGETVVGTAKEIHDAYPDLAVPRDLGPEGYWLYCTKIDDHTLLIVAGSDERGALYGAFGLLRLLATGKDLSHLDLREEPAMPIRWVDEWDNPDGSIERGYAWPVDFF